MSNFKLNLPTDIPWKRICVSEDMIDRNVGDKKFPLRWQSSIAVFSFEPDEEYQNYEDMKVSYLKVTCSITGFQPLGDEVGLQNNEARRGVRDSVTGDYLIDPSRWKDSRVIQAYKDAIEDYYGCYGAVLQVAIGPSGTREEIEKIPSSKFPFFIDFEPKKRELYEVVTETGEMMSRSLSGINVRKGSTTTEAHEVLDIFGGASVQGSYAGTGGGASVQGQWGTKDLNQTEYVDMRTTDSGQEKRESFSHTTQLSQMYHQLNSYHVGTNRALFYILPRPHTIQSADENTFVNGPRLLEGIQEFFLVALRPKEMEDICVEAYLETSHIFQEMVPVYQNADDFVDEFVVEGSLNEREGETRRIDNADEGLDFLDRVVGGGAGATIGAAVAGPIGAAIGAFLGAAWNEAFGTTLDKTTMTVISRVFTPSSPELEFDLARKSVANCSPVGERTQYLGCGINQERFDNDEILVFGSVYSQEFTKNSFFFDSKEEKKGKATIRVQVPQRRRIPTLVNGDKSLFLTGRGVKCCTKEPNNLILQIPSITWEAPFVFETGRIGKLNNMSKNTANNIREYVGELMVKSVNDVNRKPIGTTFFGETDFFTKSVITILNNSDLGNQPALFVKDLSPNLQKVLREKASDLTQKEILQIGIPRLIQGLSITQDEAQTLRRTMLGLVDAKKAPDNVTREEIKVKIPNLIGLSVQEVTTVFKTSKLKVGQVTYKDNSLPKDVVLTQSPKAEAEVLINSSVDIVLSTGESVRIPDVEQMGLTDALSMLRKAGLQREPEIIFVNSKEDKLDNRIAKVSPSMRTYITPNTKVKIEVYKCGYEKPKDDKKMK